MNRIYVSLALVFMPLAIVFGLLYWQITILNGFVMMFRSNVILWLGLGLLALIVLALGIVGANGRPGRRPILFPWIIAGLVGVGMIATGIFFMGYLKASAYNDSNVEVQAKESLAVYPEFKTRTPFIIGESQTAENLSINGSPDATTYIPSLERFGAAVVKRGTFKGYGQVVWQEIGPSGQATVENCSFSDQAQRRLNGSLSHNLERAIIRKDFAIIIDSGDSYAFCDDGVPKVVVPFKKLVGFLAPTQVPAGTAVYNGETGAIDIFKEVGANAIPGPVYPLSLAEKTRDATTASSGWWAYLTGSVGFAGYGGENSSDYTLRRADESGDGYVTPLVNKGRGKAITAVGIVDSNSMKAGARNKATIAFLPKARQGDSAVEDRLKSDYKNLEWATGMQIFEIAPTGPDTWSATLGLRKSITYRLELKADGSSCLFDVKGNKLRCSTDEADGPTEGDTGGDAPAADPDNLGALTDEEFIDLQRAIADEVARRLAE